LIEIHENIKINYETDLGALLNSFDTSLFNRNAIQGCLHLLMNEQTAFISFSDGTYSIADEAIREYFFEYIPAQRPQVPHLWLPTDSCTLRCQLKHYSQCKDFESSTLKHVLADFGDFVIAPGAFRAYVCRELCLN
jgi:hypothetical protein